MYKMLEGDAASHVRRVNAETSLVIPGFPPLRKSSCSSFDSYKSLQ